MVTIMTKNRIKFLMYTSLSNTSQKQFKKRHAVDDLRSIHNSQGHISHVFGILKFHSTAICIRFSLLQNIACRPD